MTEVRSKATAGAEGGEAGSSELGHSPCGPKRSFSTTGLTVPEKPAPQEFERKPRALGIGRDPVKRPHVPQSLSSSSVVLSNGCLPLGAPFEM